MRYKESNLPYFLLEDGVRELTEDRVVLAYYANHSGYTIENTLWNYADAIQLDIPHDGGTCVLVENEAYIVAALYIDSKYYKYLCYSLTKLRNKLEQLDYLDGSTTLLLPRLTEDGIEWDQVATIINSIFGKDNLSIEVGTMY